MASTAPIPGSENMHFEPENSLQRVTEYPVVKDTLNQAYSLVQKNPYTASVYTHIESLSTQIVNAVAPRLPLERVDGYANAGLDMIEKNFPIVKNDTKDIVGKVRKPADDAVGVAKSYADGISSRISPVTDRISSRIAQGQKTLIGLQDRLSQAVHNIPTDTQTAKASVNDAISSIIKEVESLTTYVKTNVQELPSNVQSTTKPIVDSLSEGVTHIREELGKQDVPLTAKAQNILRYTGDQVAPLLNSLKERLTTGAKKVEGEAKQVNGDIKQNAKEVNGEIQKNAPHINGTS